MQLRHPAGAVLTATVLTVTSLVVTAAPVSADETTARPAAVSQAGDLQRVVAPAAQSTAAELLSTLTVAAEGGPTYDRASFEHWVDADGDGCDTRQEVLVAESEVPVVVGAGCVVGSGQWTSWFDGATWTDPSAVDIDHFVALAEAWQSGAHAWTSGQRRDFANDLGLEESLAAVTDTVNASKGARDPAEWLPPLPDTHCRYAVSWVLVKYRWSLSTDTGERQVLDDLLGGGCGATTVEVPTKAVTVPPGPEPEPDPVAPADQLTRGQTLAAGAQLTSPNGRYRAVMQTDGNLVVYASTRALWHSRTAGNPGARLVLQGDGNLVLYPGAGRALFHTRTDGRDGARLRMQDDGNLVLYSSANRALWFTGAEQVAPPPPPPPGSTLVAGRTLAGGQALRSTNGRYRFVMQGDGNAVVYAGTRAIWDSRTGGNAGARLVMQGDGNVVVYARTGRVLFNTRTNGQSGARLVIQDDGNLVVYVGSRALWNTGPERREAPPAPPAPPAPDPRAGCSPAYPTVCIAPAPPDLDCSDIPYRRFTVLAPDPHDFDGNRDGIGCQA